jgi:hypothetical protein
MCSLCISFFLYCEERNRLVISPPIKLASFVSMEMLVVLVVKIIFAVVLNRATLDAFAGQTKRWVAEKIGCKLKCCCRGLTPLIASSNQIQPFFPGELVLNCTQKS